MAESGLPMSTDRMYPAARGVAERVHYHLARNAAKLNRDPDKPSATVPGSAVIELIVDAAFRASLRREEGRTTRLSLAFVAPGEAPRSLSLEHAFPLEPQLLARIAPAVERPGIHLAVWQQDAELSVWGATRNLPAFCFVLEVIAPGLLVLKQTRGEESGKFVNIALLEADEIRIVDPGAAQLPDSPGLLTSLLGFEPEYAAAHSTQVLIQLAISMRAHGHGGSLLVVPWGSEAWRESMAEPIRYSLAPPSATMYELLLAHPADRTERWWQDAVVRVVDGIAGLTAVDGATIITDRYELLAFGAKIIRRPGMAPVTRVCVTEPIEGATVQEIDASGLGGTRHLYAAQFAQDQREAIALIASQDGRFTVFAWSHQEGMVHAHRIETLLL